MKTGIELITAERERQVSVEGWTPEHDDRHVRGEMAQAAASYALVAAMQAQGCHLTVATDYALKNCWPYGWHRKWFKPSPDARRNLEKSGALAAAEYDRLQRLESTP